MEIRRYRSSDIEEMVRLFYETVHAVNIRDYTEQQVNVWATGEVDCEEWDASFKEHLTYVATENGLVVGFGDIDEAGYLDRLYVHKDYQNRGIATAICDRLENEIGTKSVRVHASITARPFFEKRGYRVVKSQGFERHGVMLTNFVMVKDLNSFIM